MCYFVLLSSFAYGSDIHNILERLKMRAVLEATILIGSVTFAIFIFAFGLSLAYESGVREGRKLQWKDSLSIKTNCG